MLLLPCKMSVPCQHRQLRLPCSVPRGVLARPSIRRARGPSLASSGNQHRLVSCPCAADLIEAPSVGLISDTLKPSKSGDRRRAAKKPSTGPTVVAQAAEAAVAGPLPDVLAATFPATFPTLSAARRVIRKDLVLVDGAVGNCKTDVQQGQTLQQLEPVPKHRGPRVVSLEVAYEDDSLAVVHKPWGVKMYGGDDRRTITGALRAGALKPSTHPDALPEPKPVHRLDAAVGGLLAIAKTATAVADLSAQFSSRRVHKVYHALLCGRLEPEIAVVQPDCLQQQQQQQKPWTSADSSATDLNDLRSRSESEAEDDDSAANLGLQIQQPQTELELPELLQQQLTGRPPFSTTVDELGDPHIQAYVPAARVTTSSSGSSSSSGSDLGSSSDLGLDSAVYVIDLPLESKPSYTLYQVLGYSKCPRFGGWMTTVVLSPVTGRKHQLRQHMAALGHPIVGDGKYTNDKEEHISNQGIYLESSELVVHHPTTAQPVHVKIPEPQRFRTLREQQHKRWNKLAAAAVAATEASES